MKKSWPSVSVIIPSFNMGWCIDRAIKSCQKQTYPPDEIVVIDDGSTDETEKKLRLLADKEKRIKYFRFSHNRGCALAMIHGIKKARGEWLVFIDADDELTPNSIKARLKALKKNKKLKPGLIYGQIRVKKGDKTKLLHFPIFRKHIYPYLMKELSLCCQSAMMVRRDCFQKTGFPSPDNPCCTDDDMVLTIAKKYAVLGINEVAAIMHDYESKMRMTGDLLRMAQGAKMLVQKYRKDILCHAGIFYLWLWQLRLIRSYLRAGIKKKKMGFLKVIYFPLDKYLQKKFDNIYF